MTRCIVDVTIPDGQMIGVTASGALIVRIEFRPTYRQTVGTVEDHDRVDEWRFGPEHARRIAMVAAWNAEGNLCDGRA